MHTFRDEAKAKDDRHVPGVRGAAGSVDPAGGHLRLILGIADGRVARVTVALTRNPGAASVLAGLPVDRAARTVGLLYSLCGTAQTVAALGAMEAATGRAARPATMAARAALVLIEALDQGVVRIGLDWAAPVGAAVDAEGLRALRRDLATARGAIPSAVPAWDRIGGADDGDGDGWPPPDLGAAVAALSARLRTWLPDATLLSESAGAVRAWARAGDTVPARAVALALDGAPEPARAVRPLVGWRLAEVAEDLRTEVGAGAPPTWRGRVAETGAMARLVDHPVVADLLASGAGLAARLVARLLDLRRAEAALRALAAGEPPPAAVTMTDGPGVGLAAVETARGVLLHRVVVTDGRVADGRIVAPTDWNAHPDGVLARTPLGWSATDRTALARRLHLLVLAIDPCVTYDLWLDDMRAMDAPGEAAAHA